MLITLFYHNRPIKISRREKSLTFTKYLFNVRLAIKSEKLLKRFFYKNNTGTNNFIYCFTFRDILDLRKKLLNQVP